MKTQGKLANDLIKKYVFLAAGLGFIPIPIADVAAISGLQIKMLSELAKIYEIKFSEHRIKAIVTSIFAGVISQEVAIIGASSGLKAVPIFGYFVGAATLPIASGTVTYVIGSSVIQHLDSGGNFENFNPKNIQTNFKAKFDEGRKFVINLSKPKLNRVDEEPYKYLKIYCILKPNLGKYGKVYLKCYINGLRPEKYIGTMEDFKSKYGSDLENAKDKIIKDYRGSFMVYVEQTLFESTDK
jgi:hypothetical protein